MKSVDQYIKTLLYEHDCVILPGFGGLLARRIEACYVEKLQQYIPVRKGVAFNEALRMDDGLLVYTIALREQVERSEAAEHVRKFVEDLKNNLSLQKQVILSGIGVFRLSQENKYVFEPDSTLNFESQWFGLPEVKLRPLRVQLLEDAEVYESFPSEQVYVNSTRIRWVNWAAAAMIIALLGFVGFNSQKTLNDISGKLSSLAFVSQDVSNDKIFMTKQQSSILPDAFRGKVEKYPNQEVITSEEVIVVDEASPISYDYELVVGSFTSTNAAESLKATLIDKGYDNAYIVDKKSGRFYKVVAQGTNELQKAHELRTELAKTVGSEVWILEHRN